METVYIVACGPSMREFPWDTLRGLPTIAVNGAILNVPDPAVFLTACSAFAIRSFRSDFWNTRARKVLIMGKSHRNYRKVEPFIHLFNEVHAPSRFDGKIGFSWDAFATGRNSGFCALQYAVLQGAKTIHLCGFDLNTPGHYYAEGGPSVTTINNFLMHFRTGLRILLDHGVKVISHSPVSRLNDMIPYEAL